jgi:6-phosphofructokinase 1
MPQRIGILTGGGDCPGLNAVIRAVTKDALRNNASVIGFEDGFLGLVQNRARPLSFADVSGILTAGGTILGSCNRSNPFRLARGKNPDGSPSFHDVSPACLDTLRHHRLDALVVVGGDGTMTIAHQFAQLGVNVLGIPKTIDNDLFGTDLTFGFLTAVAIATDALDRIRTTAASHHRAIFVEVMGRNAGWIALHAGIASGADIILLPEIPFSLDHVAATIAQRSRSHRRYSIICASEGARPAGGSQLVARTDPRAADPIRLGGVAKFLSDAVELRTDELDADEGEGVECRFAVLGHIQRGGTPVAADRVLATQLAHHAMTLLRAGRFGRMVAMQGLTLTDVPLSEPANKQRLVPADHHLIHAARAIGTSFGEPSEPSRT